VPTQSTTSSAGNFEERSKENFTWIHKVLRAIMTKKFCRFLNALHMNLNLNLYGPARMPLSNCFHFNPQKFCGFFNALHLNLNYFVWGSVWMTLWNLKWLKLLSTHNSKIQTYERVKVCLQFFDMWCYCLGRTFVKNCSKRITLRTK